MILYHSTHTRAQATFVLSSTNKQHSLAACLGVDCELSSLNDVHIKDFYFRQGCYSNAPFQYSNHNLFHLPSFTDNAQEYPLFDADRALPRFVCDRYLVTHGTREQLIPL